MYGLVCHNSIWKAWDYVTNVELNAKDVRAPRDLEMQYFERLRVYDRVDRSEIKRTEGKLIGTRWVDVNKGDSTNATAGLDSSVGNSMWAEMMCFMRLRRHWRPSE